MLLVLFISDVDSTAFNRYVIMQEWGFELPDNSTCDSATIRYTDFLLATAAGKVEGEKFTGKIVTPFEKTRLAAYALSAIAPCMRLYSFLSKEIKSVLVPEENNNIYERWIDCLCSESFEVCLVFEQCIIFHFGRNFLSKYKEYSVVEICLTVPL